MKRIAIIVFCITFVLGIQAKTTYIPFYSSSISITENGTTKSVDGQSNQLSLCTVDSGIKFTILHELVTKDKVKSIKSAKSNIGWTSVVVGLSQGNGTTEAVSGSSIINSAETGSNISVVENFVRAWELFKSERDETFVDEK